MLPLILSCTASSRFNLAAKNDGLVREVITQGDLPLVIYRDEHIPRSSEIHFYFDGDGSPWVDGARVARDPTSRSKLILKLMAEDDAPKILIGRPCYYIEASARPDNCTDALWTSQRYDNVVVTSMRAAVKRQIAAYQAKQVVLIGYSGGGTLAALVAAELDLVDILITIAANLNVDDWISHHGYTPLARSLNAANFPQLPQHIKQFHFVGGKDENVLPSNTRSVVAGQQKAELIGRAGYTHECCWPKTWASTLRDILN